MKHDLDRLQLELEYGQIINFDNKKYILSSSDENFKKYNKLIYKSEIALPVDLLKFHGIDIKTTEKFVKFKIIKNPKSIQSFFEKKKISKIIDIGSGVKLDNSEKKIITIFKKLNLLPFPIFFKKIQISEKKYYLFHLNIIVGALKKSKIVYRNSTSLPLKKNHNVKIMLFDDLILKTTHYALIFNEDKKKQDPLVRIHSSCLTGDLMGSQRCDCGYQLNSAIDHIARNKSQGVIIYLNQEGRGLGIHNKIISYNIQETGWDTYEADNILGFSGDERDYSVAIKILQHLKISSLRLITNNPEKISALDKKNIVVSKIVKIKPGVNKFNRNYLKTKKNIGKHFLKI
tara:strand:+ start:401 stop:1435 length:1035 start_codon:yes stop_codon:yes gene_type:complete